MRDPYRMFFRIVRPSFGGENITSWPAASFASQNCFSNISPRFTANRLISRPLSSTRRSDEATPMVASGVRLHRR
jgi:hypothetical protein